MDIRKSSRAIVINKNNEIFLFRYKFDYLQKNSAIWITPGGSLEEGESFDDALGRELFEELGVELNQEYMQIYYRNPIYILKNGERILSEEKFFLVYLDEKEFSYCNWTESENERMSEGKWWSAEEIRQSGDEFFTPDLLKILQDVTSGKIPNAPVKIA
ncbi:MAG: NUDIX domain-containing protein [Lachnospiraceae bacterium]|nr:NUDIX domain-containing protein [Lachnospiraceae bacterium]